MKNKSYFEPDEIYYKVVGSSTVHVISSLTYSSLKGEVFDLESLGKYLYKVKDNISYIHFYKCFGNEGDYETNKIFASTNTDVVITIDDKEIPNFEVYNAKSVTIKKECEDDNIFNAEINNASKVEHLYTKSLIIKDATSTILKGNLNVSTIEIYSGFLEINDFSEEVDALYHGGDEMKLNNINCQIHNFCTCAENIEVQNSNIKSFYCNFFACVKPVFINSTWNVTSSLDYMDGDIGNRENGIIITDETFSDKGCIELARAYATYILREFSIKMNGCNKLDIDSEFEKIKAKEQLLKAEYDRQLAALNNRKEMIAKGYQKRRVKNLIEKNEKKLYRKI